MRPSRPSSASQRVPPRSVGAGIVSATERFPKDFWLTPRTVLTRATPISKLNHFCVRHGVPLQQKIAASALGCVLLMALQFPTSGFFLSDLAGYTADDKRDSLYRTLLQHGWPDGYEGYMRALNEPQARGAGDKGGSDLRSAADHPKLKALDEDHTDYEVSYDSSVSPAGRYDVGSLSSYRRRADRLEDGPTSRVAAKGLQNQIITKLEKSITQLHSAVHEQGEALRHLSPPNHSRAPQLASHEDDAVEEERVPHPPRKGRRHTERASPRRSTGTGKHRGDFHDDSPGETGQSTPGRHGRSVSREREEKNDVVDEMRRDLEVLRAQMISGRMAAQDASPGVFVGDPGLAEKQEQLARQLERNAQQVAATTSNASLVVKEMGIVKQELLSMRNTLSRQAEVSQYVVQQAAQQAGAAATVAAQKAAQSMVEDVGRNVAQRASREAEAAAERAATAAAERAARQAAEEAARRAASEAALVASQQATAIVKAAAVVNSANGGGAAGGVDGVSGSVSGSGVQAEIALVMQEMTIMKSELSQAKSAFSEAQRTSQQNAAKVEIMRVSSQQEIESIRKTQQTEMQAMESRIRQAAQGGIQQSTSREEMAAVRAASQAEINAVRLRSQQEMAAMEARMRPEVEGHRTAAQQSIEAAQQAATPRGETQKEAVARRRSQQETGVWGKHEEIEASTTVQHAIEVSARQATSVQREDTSQLDAAQTGTDSEEQQAAKHAQSAGAAQQAMTALPPSSQVAMAAKPTAVSSTVSSSMPSSTPPMLPMPAQPRTAPPPPPGGFIAGGRDAHIDRLAEGFGLRSPSAGSWLDMLCEVAEQMPHAIAVTDMKIPGLPVTFCNSAMVNLTQYPKEHTQGRNCRFLQGKGTEAAAVRVMVTAIRAAKPTTVKVTNYRRDGSDFLNVLTLHPVHDSENEYRYSIGILADGGITDKAATAALDKLRQHLPSRFDVQLQPRQFAKQLTVVDQEAQRKQWKSSLAKFTRLLWSMDWEGSLRQLVADPSHVSVIGKWVQETVPEHAPHLELVVLTADLQKQPTAQQGQQAMQICQRYMGAAPPSPDAAMQALGSAAQQALSALATEVFPRFVQSKACLPLVESLLGSSGDSVRQAAQLLWHEYEVPDDVAGWVHSFATVAETYPACIVISDMSMPGNPMFFVNAEFCRVTGYAKTEAQGRNCRFLQGPRTEPQSVAVIQDTLRRGVDCHVKITNYRKSGELFENLLTMRPVHDSNGVYRFCIGVQFEVTRDMSLKSRLAKLDKLVKLLPTTIEVSSAATGRVHAVEEVAVEKTTELSKKLESALSGKTVGPKLESMEDYHSVASAGYYDQNRQDMLDHLQGKSNVYQAMPGPRGKQF